MFQIIQGQSRKEDEKIDEEEIDLYEDTTQLKEDRMGEYHILLSDI